MSTKPSRASGVGLERLCGGPADEWMQSTETEGGIELLEVRFQRSAYHKHRHDTYAICLTTSGVQTFGYRGATEVSLPGQVAVLHPDELHDGRAGTQAGFGYRIVYIEPALIFEAVQVLCGRACPLPFVRAPVVISPRLAAAITGAFQSAGDPLALDGLVVELAAGLVEADPRCTQASFPRYLDTAALERARQFLEAEKLRVVRSAELERLTGLARYDLARQFRLLYGTSPYRYLLMRRLDYARGLIGQGRPLADVALEVGFADQAHLTRMFGAAFGLTPARYRALLRSAAGARPAGQGSGQ